MPTQIDLSLIQSTSSDPKQPFKIHQVCCGFAYTCIVTDKHKLYACGANDAGQCGIDKDKQDVLGFTLVSGLHHKIEKISCGYYHTAALVENGDLYTWGSSMYGQTGHGSNQDESNPRLVESLTGKRMKNIACGAFHTVAVTDLENVYAWGRGSKGRLGINSTVDQFSPRLVEALLGKHVTSVSCGHCHTIALTDSGLLVDVI